MRWQVSRCTERREWSEFAERGSCGIHSEYQRTDVTAASVVKPNIAGITFRPFKSNLIVIRCATIDSKILDGCSAGCSRVQANSRNACGYFSIHGLGRNGYVGGRSIGGLNLVVSQIALRSHFRPGRIRYDCSTSRQKVHG